MLNITLRTAKLGSSLNGRTEKHGNDDVPAADMSVDSIFLTAAELNDLLGIKDAHDRLFRVEHVGGLPEPVFAAYGGHTLPDKFEGANVTIEHGLQKLEIELADVKIAKVYLEPQTGGLTKLSLQIQANHDWEDLAPALLSCMNKEIKIAITDAEVTKKVARG